MLYIKKSSELTAGILCRQYKKYFLEPYTIIYKPAVEAGQSNCRFGPEHTLVYRLLEDNVLWSAISGNLQFNKTCDVPTLHDIYNEDHKNVNPPNYLR